MVKGAEMVGVMKNGRGEVGMVRDGGGMGGWRNGLRVEEDEKNDKIPLFFTLK